MISVPGPDAFTEATDAVDAGCDVLETRTATTPVHFALVGSGCADLTAAAEDPLSRPRLPYAPLARVAGAGAGAGTGAGVGTGPASAPGASSRPVLRRRTPRTTIPPRKSH